MDLFDFICEDSDTVPPLRHLPEDMGVVMPRLYAQMRSLSVRARNAVRLFFDSYDNSVSRIYRAVYAPGFSVYSMKNVGRNTAPELERFLSHFVSVVDGICDGTDDPNAVSDDIEKLMPVILNEIDSLSVRSRNAITAFMDANGNTVNGLCSAITMPKFTVKRIKNVGPTNAPEVARFLSKVRSMVGLPDSETGTAETPTLYEISVPEEFHEQFSALEDKLGHFPLFAAIDAYLNGLEDDTSAIVDGCIRVRNGQSQVDIDAVADSLGLTRERVRQKRNLFLSDLGKYCSMLRTGGLISDNPYDFVMVRTEENVNATEGTDFTADFVRWVLASTFEDVVLIGDPVKNLTRIRNRGILAAVPAGQCRIFDFNAFVGEVDAYMSKKRTNPEPVDLSGFIAPFFMPECSDDEKKEVEMSCRSVLCLGYLMESDGDMVVFPANTRKNNTEIIEDILRMIGHAMTLDEIYAEFVRLYPGRKAKYDSFRGNINNNPAVSPIGRSSTYSLAEWQTGSDRGGTIRNFVDEYLDSVPENTATAENLCEYVRQFRPSSSNNSILSNLLLDKDRKYVIYNNNGQRYVSYRSVIGDDIVPSVRPEKRSREESMDMLTAFIDEHGRFPGSRHDNPDEKRLYKFVINTDRLYSSGKIDSSAAEAWCQFKEKYADMWPRKKRRNLKR